MANIKFSGSVSAQAQEQTVTINVVTPDGATDKLLAQTKIDGSFETTKQYKAGLYSATFNVDADTEYKATSFGPVNFNVKLVDRTITATITVV